MTDVRINLRYTQLMSVPQLFLTRADIITISGILLFILSIYFILVVDCVG